jgi:hypothetical protein
VLAPVPLVEHFAGGQEAGTMSALQGHCEVASGNHVGYGFRPCSGITVVFASISTGDEFMMCSCSCARVTIEHIFL